MGDGRLGRKTKYHQLHGGPNDDTRRSDELHWRSSNRLPAKVGSFTVLNSRSISKDRLTLHLYSVQRFEYRVRLFEDDEDPKALREAQEDAHSFVNENSKGKQVETTTNKVGTSSGQEAEATKTTKTCGNNNKRYPEGKRKPLSEADAATVKEKLSLQGERYWLVRRKFGKICDELNVVQKTRNEPGTWETAIGRLIEENKYINEAIRQKPQHKYEVDQLMTVLDRFCQQIAKIRVQKLNRRPAGLEPTTPESPTPSPEPETNTGEGHQAQQPVGFQPINQPMVATGQESFFQPHIPHGQHPVNQSVYNEYWYAYPRIMQPGVTTGQGEVHPNPNMDQNGGGRRIDEELLSRLDPALFRGMDDMGSRDMGEEEEGDDEDMAEAEDEV